MLGIQKGADVMNVASATASMNATPQGIGVGLGTGLKLKNPSSLMPRKHEST
jgi:hypothetical protein